MEIQINRTFSNRRNGKTNETHLYILNESLSDIEADFKELKEQIKLNPYVYSQFINKIILK